MSRTLLRHAELQLDTVKQYSDDPVMLERKLPQIQRAWDNLTSLTDSDDEKINKETLILELALRFDRHLEKSGRIEKNMQWIGRALQAAQILNKPVLTGRLGQDLGWCFRLLGKPQKALEYLELALQIRKKYGPPLGEAATLNMIGVIYTDLVDYPTAIDYLQPIIRWGNLTPPSSIATGLYTFSKKSEILKVKPIAVIRLVLYIRRKAISRRQS